MNEQRQAEVFDMVEEEIFLSSYEDLANFYFCRRVDELMYEATLIMFNEETGERIVSTSGRMVLLTTMLKLQGYEKDKEGLYRKDNYVCFITFPIQGA